MVDLDELERKRKAAEGMTWMSPEWLKYNAALREAAPELIKMARRYQWVREHPAWESEAFLSGLTPEQYDLEVDKAMALDSVQSQEESR